MFFLLNSLALCQNHGKYVTELTSRTFHKLVEGRNDSTVWIVDFQGDYCPACRQAAPFFAEAAEQSLGMVKFGSLDTQRNQDVAMKFGIRFIPTFIVFYPGGYKRYMGERTVRGFCNAAARYIPSCSEEADATWNDQKSKSVVLFTNKHSVPPMWAAISNYFKDNDQQIRIGHALEGSHQEEFNITNPPTVLAIDGEKVQEFGDRPSFMKIRVFIEKFFNGTLEPSTPKPTPTPKEIKIETIDTNDKFQDVCRKHKNCVVIAGEPTEHFKIIANKFQHDPFVFAIAPKNGELSYINKGIWIFHRSQDKAHVVDTVDHLTTALDRVLDGSQKWTPIDDLKEQEL